MYFATTYTHHNRYIVGELIKSASQLIVYIPSQVFCDCYCDCVKVSVFRSSVSVSISVKCQVSLAISLAVSL
jgi:hypothetical protein